MNDVEKQDPQAEHNILREMMERVVSAHPNERERMGKTKKNPKRRLAKERGPVSRMAVCIAGHFTPAVDETVALLLKVPLHLSINRFHCRVPKRRHHDIFFRGE